MHIRNFTYLARGPCLGFHHLKHQNNVYTDANNPRGCDGVQVLGFGQIVHKTSGTHDNSYQGHSHTRQFWTRISRTRDSSYPMQLVRREVGWLVRVNSYHHWTSHTRIVKELMNGKSLHCQCKYHSRYFYITVIFKVQIAQPDYLSLQEPERDAQMYMMSSSNGSISTLLAICAGNSPVTGDFPM